MLSGSGLLKCGLEVEWAKQITLRMWSKRWEQMLWHCFVVKLKQGGLVTGKQKSGQKCLVIQWLETLEEAEKEDAMFLRKQK